MRLHVRMVEPADEQQMVPVVLLSNLANSSDSMPYGAQGSPHLNADFFLKASTPYRIGWSARQYFLPLMPSQDVQIFVELSIWPVTLLANAIAANPKFHGDAKGCKQLALPAIVVDANGAFLWGADDLTLPVAQATTRGKIATTLFTVSSDSVFFAVLEAQFALSHTTLQLRNLNGTTEEIRYALSDRNRRLLHVVLPAGTYELALRQTWMIVSAPPTALSFCSVLSLHITVRDAWQGKSSHVADCTNYNLLPYNLSNPMPYGTPMNPSTGQLVVYGTKFLFPEKAQAAETHSYAYMQLTLPVLPSLHVLLFYEIDEPSYSTQDSVAGAQFALLGFDRVSTPFFSRPYAEQSSRTFSLGRFRVEQASGALVQMSFSGNAALAASTCPYYTFGSYTMDTTLLASSLLCTPRQLTVAQGIPSITPQLSVNGTVYQHLYGFYQTSGGPVVSTSTITVTVTTTSTLQVALSVNGFASQVQAHFSMHNSANWTSGMIGLMPAYEDHFTNTRLVATEFLYPGTFVLTVTHTSLASSAGLTNDRGQTLSGAGLCLPWIMDLWVTPYFDEVTYVSGVFPAQLSAHRPNNDLVVELAMGAVLTRESVPAKLTDLLAAFHLQTDPNCSLPMLNELSPDAGEMGAGGSGLSLRWSAGVLAEGQTYWLCMRRGALVNQRLQPIVLASTHSYRTVAANHCGPHGTSSPEYQCVCNPGYGGSDCSVCGIGFVLDTMGACVKTTRPVCQPCSCGCDAQNHDLGSCDDTSGAIVCTCTRPYKGSVCQLCADETQQANYPLCVANPKTCSPPCDHGSCDPLYGTCQCEHHWSSPTCGVCDRTQYAGADCDQCAPGHSGSACTPDSAPWSITGIVAAAAAVLAVAVAAVIGVLAVRRWRNKSAVQRQAYAMTTLGSMSDASDGDEFFDDSIANNEPTPGLLSDQFNLHLSDEDF
jgi:hypothetical protein